MIDDDLQALLNDDDLQALLNAELAELAKAVAAKEAAFNSARADFEKVREQYTALRRYIELTYGPPTSIE